MDASQPEKREHFKPSEYMRSRRPHLFSDSVQVARPSLDKGQFDYHLETLTSRKQEQLFEECARRLAEAEICPNIKPQTGPTGGGDSQVDASTYPVAHDLAERVWFGSPAQPSGEDWAFAFSCKRDWKSKIREDIAKIARLPTHFTLAYFITNQYARDKDRAKIETELSQQHGLKVECH